MRCCPLLRSTVPGWRCSSLLPRLQPHLLRLLKVPLQPGRESGWRSTSSAVIQQTAATSSGLAMRGSPLSHSHRKTMSTTASPRSVTKEELFT